MDSRQPDPPAPLGSKAQTKGDQREAHQGGWRAGTREGGSCQDPGPTDASGFFSINGKS